MEDALETAIQVAQGLLKAHHFGIIHRDIKPANVMITSDETVKIVDFGLAKLFGMTKITKTGSTLGTLAYMSPEQARSEEIDARSDIWSLGVILYEMITGQLPFKGEYENAIVYSILNEDPISAKSILPKISEEYERVIKKCLEKKPSDRYQHIDELIVDLRKIKRDTETITITREIVAPKSKTKNIITKFGWVFGGIVLLFLAYLIFFQQEVDSSYRIPIAVIDFINETGDNELNGLSGLLITDLEQSRQLEVLTRSRMFDVLRQLNMSDVNYIDEKTGREICKASDVNIIAIGTIKKFGELYTVDVKIIDIKEGKHIFAAKADGKGKEAIPSLIDDVAEKTRTELKEPLEEIQKSNLKIAAITTENLEAYQHYFQGEQCINKLKFEEAIKEFEKAIELDSMFGLAYYRLAYAIGWNIGGEELALEPMKKALVLIDRIPERQRYLTKAEYARLDKGFESSLAHLKEMEKIYPNDKEMIYLIGDYYFHLAKYDSSIKYLENVLTMDPIFERALNHLSLAYRETRQYEKMLQVAQRYVSVSGSREAYQLMASAYISLGKSDIALNNLITTKEIHPDNYFIIQLISFIYTYKGLYDDAAKELKTLINDNQPQIAKRIGYEGLMFFYQYVGKFREAIRAADKCIEINWELKDTSNAEKVRMFKAMIMYRGWNKIENAWKEAEKTFINMSKITSPFYFGNLNLLQVYHGNYKKADSLATSFQVEWWHLCIRSIIESKKRNCIGAETLVDSAIEIQWEPAKIFVLYALAECQYEVDYLDKAILSLKKLQSLHGIDNLINIGAINYPKSYYLLGKVYEKKVDKKSAIENYKRFLTIWKNADKDLPDYIDANKRLKILEGLVVK